MPARNIVKEYVENGIYHVYNRGIDKRDIFNDTRDYRTFLYFLKIYLSNKEDLKGIKGLGPLEGPTLKRRNFFGRIDLLCYCLMPNHFHLLIRQAGERDMSEFMRCHLTNYSMYFNYRYQRIGPPFQGTYKACLVKDDNYLLHLSRYIHLNPVGKDESGLHPVQGVTLSKLSEYEWSSYADYLGRKETKWLKPGMILDYFEKNKGDGMIGSDNYQNFVEGYIHDTEKILEGLTLE